MLIWTIFWMLDDVINRYVLNTETKYYLSLKTNTKRLNFLTIYLPKPEAKTVIVRILQTILAIELVSALSVSSWSIIASLLIGKMLTITLFGTRNA